MTDKTIAISCRKSIWQNGTPFHNKNIQQTEQKETTFQTTKIGVQNISIIYNTFLYIYALLYALLYNTYFIYYMLLHNNIFFNIFKIQQKYAIPQFWPPDSNISSPTHSSPLCPSIFGQLTFGKGSTITQWRKDSPFNKYCVDNWIFTCKRMNEDPYLHHSQKLT